MSSGTGALNGINSRTAISAHITRTFPSPHPKMTTMTAMLCIPCKEGIIVPLGQYLQEQAIQLARRSTISRGDKL